MKLDELVQMRDDINKNGADLETIERKAEDIKARIKEMEEACAQVENANKRLASLVAMRGQIHAAKADADVAEQEVASLKATTADLQNEIEDIFGTTWGFDHKTSKDILRH